MRQHSKTICMWQWGARHSQNQMLTFLFWVSKLPKNGQRYCYTLINIWSTITLVFTIKKSRNSSNNISTYCLIFNVGQKHWFLACSFKMLAFFKGWNFQDVLKLLQKSKSIACSISQYVTNLRNKKNCVIFLLWDWDLPSILNTEWKKKVKLSLFVLCLFLIMLEKKCN